MKPHLLRSTVAIIAASIALGGCSSTGGGLQPAASVPTTPQLATIATGPSAPDPRSAPRSARAMAVTPLCPATNLQPGETQCAGLFRSDIATNPTQVVSVSTLPGLHPVDLTSAYGLGDVSARGTGQTVAVVVAYDDPLVAADNATYRAEFGLPACSVTSGCLTVLGANATTPAAVSAWAAEAVLDVDMVSAICPNCKIVVSEAATDRIADLAVAVRAAVAAGATVVSNSYTIPEDPSLLQYAKSYDVPGVPMTAGAGDNGFGVAFPASSPHVTAVGGTTLGTTAGVVQSETVWNQTGSGCSTLFAKPSWQHDEGCAMRTVNDTAVVGDPATGVAVYATAFGGWGVFGGTSVGAPVVAAMYALAGNQAHVFGNGFLYNHRAGFRFISGSSGSCKPAYLCTALGNRYSGPAGLGTPVGLAAF